MSGQCQRTRRAATSAPTAKSSRDGREDGGPDPAVTLSASSRANRLVNGPGSCVGLVPGSLDGRSCTREDGSEELQAEQRDRSEDHREPLHERASSALPANGDRNEDAHERVTGDDERTGGNRCDAQHRRDDVERPRQGATGAKRPREKPAREEPEEQQRGVAAGVLREEDMGVRDRHETGDEERLEACERLTRDPERDRDGRDTRGECRKPDRPLLVPEGRHRGVDEERVQDMVARIRRQDVRDGAERVVPKADDLVEPQIVVDPPEPNRRCKNGEGDERGAGGPA